MTLKNKLAIITAASTLAFAGVGFAAWVFNNTVATDNAAGTPQVTCAVELNDDFELWHDVDADGDIANDVKLTTLYLICDAPESGNTHVLPGHGVYWSTVNTASAYTYKVGGSEVYIKGTINYSANDIDDLTSITVTFTDHCALTAGTYVEFAAATLPAAVTISGNDLIDGAEVKSANFALPVPSYKAAVNNFATVAEADNVDAGLAGLVVGYNAQITAKA